MCIPMLLATPPDKLLGADDTPASKQDVTPGSLSNSFDSVQQRGNISQGYPHLQQLVTF